MTAADVEGKYCCRISRGRGFTMIELLVVIAIIGVILAIVLSVAARVKRAAYGAATSAQLAALSSAIQQYYNDYKAYPGPLSNDQLGSFYAPAGNQGRANIQGINLTYSPDNLLATTLNDTTLLHISGTQNLTLGLLGGLECNFGTPSFVYKPDDIFPDGKTPDPLGPPCLNPNTPHPPRAYIQVSRGDISLPSMVNFNTTNFFGDRGTNGNSFADTAGRSPGDAPIPVFLDRYPDPLPILYIRANLGGQAIAGVRNHDSVGGNALIDPANPNVTESPQYDLAQVLDYTKSSIGLIANSSHNYHGLQGLGNANLTDTVAGGYANAGQNALAYLQSPINSNNPSASNTHQGVARQKDGFILIAAGPDRIYGTPDDIIVPQ